MDKYDVPEIELDIYSNINSNRAYAIGQKGNHPRNAIVMSSVQYGA